jgi:hypothetical protein
MIFEKGQKILPKNDEETPRGRSVFGVSHGMAHNEPRMLTVQYNSYIVYRKRKRFSCIYYVICELESFQERVKYKIIHTKSRK